MDKKLKKGDKVRMRRTVCFDYITFEEGCVSEVSADEDNKGFCRIRMKNAESGEMTEHFICACNLEPIDGKTAFLMELKGLMEKYDASINVGWNDCWQADDRKYPLIDMCIQVGNNPYAIAFDDVLDKSLAADNIMDYNKE